jgi:hypothetical protein
MLKDLPPSDLNNHIKAMEDRMAITETKVFGPKGSGVSGTLTFDPPYMILVGGTAQSIFTEYDPTGKATPAVYPVTFSSDNIACITVDEWSGVCTAIAVGTAMITAADGRNRIQSTAQLEAKPALPVAVAAPKPVPPAPPKPPVVVPPAPPVVPPPHQVVVG